MTNMAATPIYGKNHLKSSPDVESRWPWDLVCTCSIGDVEPINIARLIILV